MLSAGYQYDSSTGLYYDANTRFFYDSNAQVTNGPAAASARMNCHTLICCTNRPMSAIKHCTVCLAGLHHHDALSPMPVSAADMAVV